MNLSTTTLGNVELVGRKTMKIAIQFSKQLNFDLVSYILFFLLIIQLSFCIWAINKGFDFSDEAFAFLGYSFPNEISKSVTYYVKLFTSVFGFIKLNIINIRIIKLLIIIISASVFFLGTYRFIKNKALFHGLNIANLYLFIIIGNLMINVTGIQSISYNFISVALFQLIVGAFLLIYSQDNGKLRVLNFSIYFVIGVLLFALFMVKFSNSILLLSCLLFLVVFKYANLKAPFIFSIIVIIGFFLAGLMLFGGFNDLQSWLKEYIFELSNAKGYDINSLLDIYKYDAINVNSKLILPNITISLIGIYSLIFAYFSTNHILKNVHTLLFTGIVFFISFYNKYYLGGSVYENIFTFIYILLVLLLFSSISIITLILLVKKIYAIDNQTFIFILFMLFIPVMGSFGTSNNISYQIIVYMPFIFSAIGLLSYLHSKHLYSAILVLVSINATFQIVSGVAVYPYRVKGSLFDQKFEVSNLENANNIKFDMRTKTAIEEINDVINKNTKYKSGMPIFSYRSEFGFIYFMNGVLPGWSWYKDELKSFEINCSSLRKTKLVNLNQTIFILPSEHPLEKGFSACLNSMNIDFPNSYVQIGEVSHFRSLAIYAPKNILK